MREHLLKMWMYVCFAALLVVGAYAEDKTSTVGNITTKVLGQSGKIQVYKGDNVSDGVTITFSGLTERQADGSKINSHTFNNFASQQFTFSDLENTTYPDSNVSVVKFSFTATISVDNASPKLTSEVFMFSEDGNITVDGNEVQVSEGEMKFNVLIENWPFCNPCTQGNADQTGEFLDFDVDIKGAGEVNMSSDGVYDLGDGATLFVPKQVIYDDETTAKDMPTGYPKFETQGAKSIFIFRFEKFSTKAFYDPTVDLGQEGGDNTGEGTTQAPVAEETLSVLDVEVKVRGQSGKISMISSDSSTSDSAKNTLTVEFDNLQEISDQGAAINDRDHKFNTFANQDFAFTTLPDADYLGTEIAAKQIEFKSTLTNNAKLTINMYLFKEGGVIENDQNENITVKQGTLKFNVEIENWAFCTSSSPCNGQTVGQYLDFEIVMKGKSKASKKDDDGTETYDLGSGVVELTKEVIVDGVSTTMVDGYPMLVSQGSKDKFKFRFPVFTNNVVYDPTMTLNSPDNGGRAVHASLATLLVAIMSVILSKLF